MHQATKKLRSKSFGVSAVLVARHHKTPRLTNCRAHGIVDEESRSPPGQPRRSYTASATHKPPTRDEEHARAGTLPVPARGNSLSEACLVPSVCAYWCSRSESWPARDCTAECKCNRQAWIQQELRMRDRCRCFR